MVDCPALLLQQPGHGPIAITAVQTSKFEDGVGQCRFVCPRHRLVALGCSWLPHYTAGKALRDAKPFSEHLHCIAPASGAYQFPEATSFSIAFSKDRSATMRFNRAFSRSRSLNFFACSSLSPPYSLRQR